MTNDPDGDGLRLALRAALTDAMRSRDTEAVSVYRSGMAAIDNAEAVPQSLADGAGAIESSPLGPGATDRPRRALSDADIVGILRAEVSERREAAELVRATKRDAASAMDRQADLLAGLIDASPRSAVDG